MSKQCIVGREGKGREKGGGGARREGKGVGSEEQKDREK
jgi:hypothetical protein